jgi:hypothetical protein
MDQWNCASCPAMEPMAGSMCTAPNTLSCPYGAATCRCFGGNWACF